MKEKYLKIRFCFTLDLFKKSVNILFDALRQFLNKPEEQIPIIYRLNYF